MNVSITVLLEETMDCKTEFGAHAKHSVHRVGTGTQMRDSAQKLHRMILLLKRIIGGTIAQKFDAVGVEFKLALFYCGNDDSLRNDGRTVFHNGCKRILIEFGFVNDDLQMLERRAIVESQKRHGFAIASRAHPTCNSHVLSLVRRAVFQNLRNVDVLHKLPHYVK